MLSRSLLLGVLFFLAANGQVIDFNANRESDPFAAFNFWPFTSQFKINFQSLQPWWKGPNVCVERSVVGGSDEKNDTSSVKETEEVELLEQLPSHFQGSLTFSSCFETYDKYECITKTNIHGDEKTHVVKYKCCHGFTRSPRFGEGCVKQADLLPLVDVLEKANATDFKRLIEAIGLDDKVSGGNYTLFAPLNEALDNITNVVADFNKVEVVRRYTGGSIVQEMMLNHIVPGFIDLNDYVNEDLIYSEDDNSSIRLNYYPTPGGGKLVTANCARVIRANLFASNGFVHTIDNVLPRARGNIKQVLEDPEASLFKQALVASKLNEMFERDGHYTIFLPTNSAFDRIDAETRKKVLSGSGCAATILKHHITPHTVCAAAIVTNATVHDYNGEILNMERLSEDEISLDGTTNFVSTDSLYTNGVVHFIDSLLIPDTALPVDKVLGQNNQSKFLHLAQEAGVQLDSISNVTVFVPFDAAFDEPAAEKYINEVRNDKEKLRELVLYHITKGKLESTDMDESRILETEVDGRTLSLKVYPLFSNIFFKTFSPAPLIQCASLTKVEEKACGSVIHEIDSLLIPPSKTLLQLIEEDSRLSAFRLILEGTETEGLLKDPDQSLTLIATTNYGFGRYKYDLDQLKQNKTLADAILKRHVIKRPVCCQQLENGEQIFNRWSPFADHFMSAQTMKNCDIIATNGILHTTNTLMYQQRF